MKIYLHIRYAKYQKIPAYILDLSRSGMGLAAKRRMEKGKQITITPKLKFLPELEAEIIYVTKMSRKEYSYRTGVKFIGLNQKQRRSLGKFIDKFERRGKKP